MTAVALQESAQHTLITRIVNMTAVALQESAQHTPR